MKSLRLNPCAAAVAIAALQMANPAFAVNCTLTTNGLWQTPGDWSCAARPGANDSATITIGGLVTINQAEQITTLANAGTISIGAGSLTLLNGGSTTNTGTINVGGASNATLQVSNNLNNTGGTINVGTGSVMVQDASVITGGTIVTTGSGKLVASNNGGNVLTGVTLNGTLDLATAAGFERIAGSGITLNGAANINANSVLAFDGGNQAIGGAATITFGNSGSSNRLSIENGGVLNTGAGVLIHGENGTIGGQVLVGGASTINNGGTISGDVAGGSINLVANTTNNSNTLSARNGGQLVLSGTVANSAAGHIDSIGAGSTVVQNGVTIAGGTINTSGGGRFIVNNNGANILSAATLNGTIDLATSTGQERVQNGITLASGSNVAINTNSILAFDGGTQTLGGTGTVTFGNTGSSNRLTVENTGTLTVGSGILIHGENGSIGGQALVGGAATIINNGTISADVAGGTITIQTNNGATNAVQNNGTLSALNGGTLVLSSNVTGNAGSSINAGSGSTVVQNGVTVSGVVNTSGTGNFVATNNGGNIFNNVSLTGALNLASATGSETVRGNLALNGAVNVNNNSTFVFEGGSTPQSLSGTGTITLGNTGSSNRIGVDNTGTLTIGSGILIHGENGTIGGQVNVGGGSTIINNGTISADVAGGTINLTTNNGAATAFTNNGTLSALNGGTLVLSTNVTGGAGGAILAGAGSNVIQNGVTLSGVINTSGGGNFVASNNGGNFLNGATLNGNLNLATTTGSEQIVNGLTLNGDVAINQNSVFVFQGGTQTLNGNGTVTLGDTGSSNRVGIDNTGTLNVGSGITIHGQNGSIGGQVNVGGASTLNNGGTITADVSGGTINLNASTTNNSSVLSAVNGGSLVLNGTVNNVGSGHVDANGTGSTVVQNGVTITGGTLNTSGGGRIVATNNGGNVLSGVTIAGTLDIATTAGSESIVNGVTVNGDVRINNNSTFVFAGGTQTLGGSGTLTLGNSGGSNRIAVDNTGTLNIASGVTIRGDSGTIGGQVSVGGVSTINNAGTIRADVAGGVINLSPGVLTNNGTLAATAGTLNVGLGFTGTGTVMTGGAGQVNLAGAASVGNLVNNGTTATALNVGLNNVTVSSDYSNANFGTGNGFNKRANVAGTGLILASGTTAQAVTGATVTAGGSAAPTLTINNVRVGSTTYNYQVANAGTSGPALRGAIQTGTAGGNITDARLSGSGVTAGNYGPVATGSNSGDLGVTFTTNTAGLIAPLVGQAVHLANNFANVAEQTLNIVTGAGAAAYNAAIGSATPSPVALGNTRVNGSLGQTFTVRNTATAGAFSEDLNAAFGASTGAASAAGSINGLVAGGVNSSAMSASLNTSSAGAKTGSVTLNYATAGTVNGVSNGLGALGIGSQTINLSGNVYQTAAGTITTAPLNFGTVQVGQTVSQTLNVQNSATGAAGFVEDLNARFGSATGTNGSFITGSGTISGLAAGGSSSGLTVGVNTSSAGTVNGSIAVNFFSAGSVGGVSNGLGELGVGSANYGVNGTIATVANVVNQASPVINNSPIALGNVRIGATSPTGLVSVTNQATTAPQAALNASIAGNGGITATGSFNLLNPGATNGSSLAVGLNTGTAGNKSGTATVSFVSDASNIGGCGTACQMNLASQNVAVTGAVYRLANPSATPTTVTVAGRVGSVAPVTAINITNASPDIYTEGLSVTRGATSSGFTSSGGITNLTAGGTSGAIGVTLDTSTAGTFSGTQALGYVSTGAGTTGAADIGVGTGSVALNGKVYTTAVATNNTPTVNFGIVHVGDSASRSVSVSNSAAVTALNDTLVASAGGASGPFTASGSVSGLNAGATSNALSVGLNTGTAGVYSGSATFGAASHDADLSDAALANLAVSLSGTVNNYATDRFSFGSGAGSLTQVGSTYILDYGTVAQGTGTRSTTLTAGNGASGPADLLDGAFQFLDPADFAEAGFADFLNLAAGQSTGPLTFSFSSMAIGSFMDTIVLHGVGHNASGYAAALGDIQLVVRGVVAGAVTPPVAGVPEPDSLLLLGLGIPLLFLRRRRNGTAVH